MVFDAPFVAEVVVFGETLTVLQFIDVDGISQHKASTTQARVSNIGKGEHHLGFD
jgi:hypothetical protein